MGLLKINTINRNIGATSQIYLLQFRLLGTTQWLSAPEISYNQALPISEGGILPLKIETPSSWIGGSIQIQMGTISGGSSPVFGAITILSITAVNCPEPCGTFDLQTEYDVCTTCTLAMTVTSPSVSRLSATTLIATDCTIGSYVIDWRKGSVTGAIAFTSGSSIVADASVTVLHPFTNEVLEGGTYYPVIRFVYLNGIRYDSINGTGLLYAPILLTCIASVVVSNMTCSNGADITSPYVGSYALYKHGVIYNNISDSVTLASRSFRFDLDATNRYFAWNFIGYAVTDQMKITHVSPLNNTSIELENWIVGYDANNIGNVTTTPKVFGRQQIYKITSLTFITYAAGDYLRIEMIPGSNTNTNWAFYCRCFQTIDSNVYDSSMRLITPGSLTFIWNSTLCVYVLTYGRLGWDGYNDSIFYKYHYKEDFFYYGGYIASAPIHVSTANLNTTTVLHMRKQIAGGIYSVGSVNNCVSQVSTATVTRSGDVVTMIFANATDYNAYKTSVNNALTLPVSPAYSSDNTIFNYYKYLTIYIRIAASCGDAVTTKSYVVHQSNPPVFNDTTLTMTITKGTIVNGYIATGACDGMVATAASTVSTVNYFASGPDDYSTVTSVRSSPDTVYAIYANPYTTQDTDTRFKMAELMPSVDTQNLALKGFNSQGLPQYQWLYHLVNERIVITDAADPENNFEFYRWIPVGTGIETANYMLVYKKLAGVITDNIVTYNGNT